MITDLQATILHHFANREGLSPKHSPKDLDEALKYILKELNLGNMRIASKDNTGTWQTHDWLKKAILLYFKTQEKQIMGTPSMPYFDKVPLRWSADNITDQGTRVVPGALIRTGTYIGKNTVLMPCFVNIGAYIDEGCMIDTWATIGSCAQIGKNVHISGGAGIGGVLEPLQAQPTIIEDDCFIGARSEIVEGVIIESGAVIAMGVFLSQSTKIFDRTTKSISYGRIPKNAVVIPGSLPSEDGSYALNCAIIAKYADKRTRDKVGINTLLRET